MAAQSADVDVAAMPLRTPILGMRRPFIEQADALGYALAAMLFILE